MCALNFSSAVHVLQCIILLLTAVNLEDFKGPVEGSSL